jgi:hypothetical protein
VLRNGSGEKKSASLLSVSDSSRSDCTGFAKKTWAGAVAAWAADGAAAHTAATASIDWIVRLIAPKLASGSALVAGSPGAPSAGPPAAI